MATSPNYINHIALVLDASGSMESLRSKVIEVADAQIAHLAKRSQELDQETRVTVYSFDDTVKCLIYDKDVLRLPSIKSLYHLGGMTALIDATMKSLDDLSKTATLYGDHAFLVYVLTDGQENRSRHTSRDLTQRLQKLDDNWTLAAFVPNQEGMRTAKNYGFLPENIAVWETSAKGMEKAGQVILQATDAYMTMRSTGVRGSRSLFTLDTSNLSAGTVQATLDALTPGQFRIYRVPNDIAIADFIEAKTKRPYRLGEAFYQLTKRETIQAAKKIALYEAGKHRVFTGDAARKLLGLPNADVKVSPTDHPKYDFFVQSTSVNRKLIAGTDVLVLS